MQYCDVGCGVISVCLNMPGGPQGYRTRRRKALEGSGLDTGESDCPSDEHQSDGNRPMGGEESEVELRGQTGDRRVSETLLQTMPPVSGGQGPVRLRLCMDVHQVGDPLCSLVGFLGPASVVAARPLQT